MSNKIIALFDMDGTLTPVRKQMKQEMVDAINMLTQRCRVGIVTGSKYSYVVEQMPQLFEGKLASEKIDVMPCNGTKLYTFNGKEYEIISDIDMMKKIGRSSYTQVIHECISCQLEIMMNYDIPFTGTFTQYRGSLLNWCPVGRDAGDLERESFVNIDTKTGIRKKYKDLIQTRSAIKGIDIKVALGGSTSLDIYPTGWDKTYSLNHYPEHEAYFVGDKCQPGGNDWHLYEKLQDVGKSYQTNSCEQTIQIIEDIASRISKKQHS